MLGEGANNATRWAMIAAFCGTGLGTYLLGKKMAGSVQESKLYRDTPPWALFLLMGSYALLVPGLVFDVFHYGVWAMGGGLELTTSAENMSGFAAELMAAGGWYGSIAVIVYAMVIPAIKLVLFFVAQVYRDGRPEQIRHARRCIITLQVISKWASPDMFAYILMIYLIRGLNHPPLLQSTGHLDFGFTCFSLFCIFSTVSTLGIKVPPRPSSGREIVFEDGPAFSSKVGVAIAASLFVVFSLNFVLGVITPCMALRLNMDLLYTPTGPIDIGLKPFVDALNLPAIANSNVSLWNCMIELANWTLHGHANGFLAFALYAVFVMGFTIADMVLLLVIAVRCHAHIMSPKTHQVPRKMMAMSKLLKKMSMLDVAVVGVTLVVACGQVYKSQGCNLSYRWGLLALFLAEVCHYVMYHSVHRMVPPASEQDVDDVIKPNVLPIGKSIVSLRSLESTEQPTEPEPLSEVDTFAENAVAEAV